MKKLQKLIKHSTRIIFLISICILSVLFFFSEEILGLFGQGYVIANNALLFLISFTFALSNSVANFGIIMRQKESIMFLIYFYLICINSNILYIKGK